MAPLEKDINPRHWIRHGVAVDTCLSSALCAAGDPRIKNIVVGICGAFPTMGNRELNHAQIDSMPHAVF